MILVTFIDVCAFKEVGTSFNFCRLALEGKALYQSAYLEILGGLAAEVLRQVCLVPGLAGGQTWCLGPQGPIWCLGSLGSQVQCLSLVVGL